LLFQADTASLLRLSEPRECGGFEQLRFRLHSDPDRMKVRVMSQMIQLGNTQLDETKLVDLCRQYHVRELSVFGSAARGNTRPDSDIDLLVEFIPEAKVDLFEYSGLMLDLSKLIGRKVDLVSKKGLKPLIRTSVLKEARLLYAA
ncbi:MAG: nucleotidyltransferase family protein, partial [Acidobacteriota bacterium]|nr:nucleotidyltransferase family protein [Acidobacteriota bacterium]